MGRGSSPPSAAPRLRAADSQMESRVSLRYFARIFFPFKIIQLSGKWPFPLFLILLKYSLEKQSILFEKLLLSVYFTAGYF